ncbi:MAG: archease [Nanoarchaeota archaeon]|nr:archease [Nanoarchaeota archaeon]MBU1051983.1 archease [Nanoarchaeota archaeon]
MKYTFLPHTADIKFKAYGKTLNQAFENAALAISKILAKENKVKTNITKDIELEGIDQKSLFYNFLEEIIFLFDAEHFIVSKASIKITKYKLTAKLKGDNASNYQGLDHIKAATYAEMHIKKTQKGWEVQAVVDV